tara:strand:+ start:1164 stop:1544 length:381 start_codon:yes stop_codon:yes gene_type:complete
MDSKVYINQAKQTESKNFDEVNQRVSNEKMLRILHAGMGVSTEAGELLDALKKHIYYGKKLDEVNIFEEVGDIFWYLAILADELGFSFEKAMDRNIEKLKTRYGHKFSEHAALLRNLEQERQTLQK